MKALDALGDVLDAEFELEGTAVGFDLIVMSRSGSLDSPIARNPHYEDLVEILLRRSAALDAVLLGGWVESTLTAGLPPDERLLLAPAWPYPVQLQKVEDFRRLRVDLCRPQAGIARRPGAKGPGNRNKRVRFSFGLSPQLPQAVIRRWLGGAGNETDIAPMPPAVKPGMGHTELIAALTRWADRYGSAPPRTRARVSTTIERGPVGALVKEMRDHRCQLCDALSLQWPRFLRKDGRPYVEAHHVVPVSTRQGSVLHPANVICLCAAHHRQLHSGAGMEISATGAGFRITTPDGTAELDRLNLEA